MATQIGGIDIIFKEANHDFSHRWHQFNPDKVTLPKGWRKEQGRRALTEDIIFESDVAVPLRDGVTIYADVFRPISSEGKPVPAILAWSPYGKQGNGKSWQRSILKGWGLEHERNLPGNTCCAM